MSGLAVKDANGKMRRVSSSAIWLLRSLRVQLSVSQVKHLSPEQKDAISAMQSPSEIPVKDFPIDRSIDIFIYVFLNIIYIYISLSIYLSIYLSAQYTWRPGTISWTKSVMLEERRCLYSAMDRRFEKGGVDLSHTFPICAISLLTTHTHIYIYMYIYIYYIHVNT